MDIIEIRNINKSYGENRVLNDISLKVAKGEVVSIIGPSGSGKSTLLRSIADLETVDSGSILIEGYDITEKSMDKKEKKKILLKTGMVFQNFNLFPHMTVRNNIARTLKVVKKASAKEADEITKQMLAKVGLIDKIDNYPNELSGGQKQRAAIARAMALDPDIMLFDEPTSALDPELVKEVLDLIKKLRDEKTTMLIVSHEMKFVKEISDKVIVMEKGKILEEGTSGKVFENSSSERVREFLKK
ncbi:Arginine transport ATP-binding protein ArtM [Sebaldella termitidis]|jgi:ABC-type polar amino acid transport system ATPase subunit|uniref:ABC transporter related protein n=1 Tax=Sebaldella termitidis (strain ATCC 33386 / NCTC 11300) TaxID=526218 RepID=D1AK58_SEBTE|nr:ABC transporter related protein [Sebaldella termitidis ATCC 33386]SUI24293.1 Arginine transport ATP-binding protein ArtM [Sebaldella termitidis]